MRAHITLTVLIGLLLLARPVRAEERSTTTAVALRKQPGESQPAVATLPAGTTVEVLETRGRWLRVRAGKARGWLTRTTVTTGAAVAPPPATAPSARADSRLTVEVVGPGAVLRRRPDGAAPVVARFAAGVRLSVVDAGDRVWIQVRDAAGRAGWVERERVDNGGGAVAAPPPSRSGARPRPAGLGSAAAAVAAAPGARGPIAVRATAALGYRSLDERFSSNGGGGLAAYLISADAAVAEVGLDARTRPAGPLQLGVDGGLRLSYSSPGIDYGGPSMPAGEIPFRMFEVEAGLRAGYHRAGLDLALRAGGFYGAFLADEVANAGRLPRESLLAATAGLRVDLAPAGSRVGLTGSFDLALAGRREQTRGLEDGERSDAGALWAGLVVHYRLHPRLVLLGAYGYERATTRWQGASSRQPDVTDAERVDASQILQIGLGTGW
jgi:SH3-like domain-containing protein